MSDQMTEYTKALVIALGEWVTYEGELVIGPTVRVPLSSDEARDLAARLAAYADRREQAEARELAELLDESP